VAGFAVAEAMRTGTNDVGGVPWKFRTRPCVRRCANSPNLIEST
jgi:hypothetical protein